MFYVFVQYFLRVDHLRKYIFRIKRNWDWVDISA